MSKIMISELTETTTAPDTSYIAIDNGTVTNKITIANYNENANATAKHYAEEAQGFAGDANTAKGDAIAAKNEAETLVGNASSYANAANTSAASAAGSASEASGYVGAAQTSASNALASARAAEASAAGIEDQVKLAKSWAVGNTGARAGEATNNAMYWAGQAAAAAGGGVVSFNSRTGSVLPEDGDYSSDMITHTNSNSTVSDVETELNSAKANITRVAGNVSALDNELSTFEDDVAAEFLTKEDKFIVLDEILAAGATQVTFTNAAITAAADVWIRTNKPGLNWTNATDTEGSCTITYPAQSSPTTVRLLIRR